eukprot:COSAG06_NODE_1943_length_8009_cov_18.211884_3_plen_351_part_00
MHASWQGRVSVRGQGATAAGGQLKFEIIKQPKWGQFGWNNSVSGEFIYSPRDYTLETTNHGVESENAIPGCKYDCANCPNAIAKGSDMAEAGLGEGIVASNKPVPAAECGPTSPEDDGFIPCTGESVCCEGHMSALLDKETRKKIPIASEQQKRWVVGYTCPEVGEQGGPTQQEVDDYDKAYLSKTDDITLSGPDCGLDTCYSKADAAKLVEKVECADVPPRLCATHVAKVPYDEFKFRAMNDFGSSNWATVKIVFERADSAAGFLQFATLMGGILMTMTCCGLLRVIALQFVLQPYRRYELCGKICGGFCAPPEEAFVLERTGADYKPDFLKEGYEETENPIIGDDDDE